MRNFWDWFAPAFVRRNRRFVGSHRSRGESALARYADAQIGRGPYSGASAEQLVRAATNQKIGNSR